MASVVCEKTRQKLIGPGVVPPLEATRSPAGLNLSNEKPVPPPDFWMRAVCFTVSKISSMLSPIGRTKHALSIPPGLFAFISVGELGRNFNEAISS